MILIRRHLKWVFWLVVVTGMGCWLVVGVRWLNRPALGVIKSPAADSEAAMMPAAWVSLDGELAVFMHRDDLSQRPAQNHQLPGDQLILVAQGGVQRQLAIEAIAINRPLNEDPSVRMRRQDPGTYTEERRTIAGDEVIIFSRQGSSYEQVAFWRHGGRVATIALTATVSSNQALKDEFAQILVSWRWKSR